MDVRSADEEDASASGIIVWAEEEGSICSWLDRCRFKGGATKSLSLSTIPRFKDGKGDDREGGLVVGDTDR